MQLPLKDNARMSILPHWHQIVRSLRGLTLNHRDELTQRWQERRLPGRRIILCSESEDMKR